MLLPKKKYVKKYFSVDNTSTDTSFAKIDCAGKMYASTACINYIVILYLCWFSSSVDQKLYLIETVDKCSGDYIEFLVLST